MISSVTRILANVDYNDICSVSGAHVQVVDRKWRVSVVSTWQRH